MPRSSHIPGLKSVQSFYIDSQLLETMRGMTITDDQKAVFEAQLEKWFASETGDNEEWEQAKQRLAKLDRMEKNLQDIFLEEEISKEDFKERRLRIQAERTNLRYLVDTIESRRGLVRADFKFALRVVNNLDSIFEKGDNDNLRLLCETMFKQVRIRDGKIVDVEMNSPFRLIVSQAKGSESLLSGQPLWKHSELLFEKKNLIPALRQILTACL